MHDQWAATAAAQHLHVVVVRDGRHPIALLVMVAALLSGLMGLLLAPDPAASLIDRYVPEPWETMYNLSLVFSSAAVLTGVWLPRLRDRLMVEQIGLWFLSGALLAYPTVVWVFYSHRLGLGSMISLLCGIGCLGRVTEIVGELRMSQPRKVRS
jgi:hypothetical protein